MNTITSRRSFLKVSVLAGGGMMLNFNSLLLGKTLTSEALTLPAESVRTQQLYQNCQRRSDHIDVCQSRVRFKREDLDANDSG